MYNHIGLSIINEDYQVTDTSDINFADVMNALPTNIDFSKQYPLLMTIEPYDNTFFNFTQCKILKRELEQIDNDISDKLAKKSISDTVDFLVKVQSLHYAHFIGD